MYDINKRNIVTVEQQLLFNIWESLSGPKNCEPLTKVTVAKVIKTEIKNMTIRELKSYCKTNGYVGYTNMNKAEILKLLEA